MASKCLLGELARDLLRANSLSGIRIDLASASKPVRVRRGGEPVPKGDYHKVITHLLNLDADTAVTAAAKDRRRYGARVAKLQTSVDLPLLQATTELRISEALAVTWDDVHIHGNGRHAHHDLAANSETHRGHTVPVLDDRVKDRLLR